MKMLKKFKLLDKNKELFTIEIQIKSTGELTMSSDSGSGCGQHYFEPADDNQQNLLDIRKKRHLNHMCTGTPNMMKLLEKNPTIKEYEDRKEMLLTVDKKGNPLTYLQVKDIRLILDSLIPGYERDIVELNQISTMIDNLSDEAKHKSDTRIRIPELLRKFVEENNLSRNSITLSKDNNAIYFRSTSDLIMTVINKGKKILLEKIAECNGIIQEHYQNLASMCAYYDILEGEVVHYGGSWFKEKLPADIEKTIDDLVDKVKYQPDGEVITSDNAIDYDTYDDKIIALAISEGITSDEIDDIELDGNRVTHYGTEYLVGTEDEMHKEHVEYLESLVQEIGAIDLKDHPRLSPHVTVDYEGLAEASNRGENLNRRDGSEETADVNGTTYYIYRQ